ncbi:MAG: polysaccharide biosynthesis protein, partial [Verrucomicrobiota bacterium]
DTLARRMIELSGLVPEVDIPIHYMGLRPGEKEYEELLLDDENVERTEDDRIWVVKEGAPDVEVVDLGRLLELIDQGCPDDLREFAHSRIPNSHLTGGVRLAGK